MAIKTWNGSNGTWATAASWSPTGVPAAADEVRINGGTVTVAAQTCATLTIGGSCTLAGTGLTVSGAFTVNSGTITIAMTASLNLNGNISNTGGTITHTGAGAITMAGATSVDANFGDNNLRLLTLAKTGSGGVTFSTSQVNVQGTNSNSSIFTYTSGAIIQNVVIQCGGIVNTSATARIWAMNADLILSAGGNAIGCSMNSGATCTFSSRSGTVRVRSLTNGGNNTLVFPTPAVSTTAAASYTPNVSLESNTNWSITGSVNNIAIDGQHTGTAGTLTVYGTITSNSGDRTWTTSTLLIYNATNGSTRTISAGNTTFLAATIAPITGTTATFTIQSLKAVNITCSGTSCTYNLGVQDDDAQLVQLSSNNTLTLSGNSSTFNLYNVRSYNTTMSSTGTYNCYHLEHNYFGGPTAGTTTHSAGTLNIKSGYTLTTYAFTSNSGTRNITFEDNSYITTLNTGPLLMGYTSLTSNCSYDNAGFLHQSTGQVAFTGTPSGVLGANNTYNLWLSKVNNSVGATTVRNLTIVDGASMVTAATITFCKNFTGYTGSVITGLSVTQSASIGTNGYVNYTGTTITTFTGTNGTGANQYIYNLRAATISLSYSSGAWVYIGSDGTNNDGAVNINTTGTVTLAGNCTYYIYNLRGYNATLTNTGTYNCYYYEHNYATNPPTAGTVTHTAGTLVLKANTGNWSMNTWGFTSTTGTRGITFENEGYLQTQNTGPLSVNYTSLTSVCPETDTSGFFHNSSGAWQIGPNAPATPAAAFNICWTTRATIAASYVKNLGNWVIRGDGYRFGGGLLNNTAAVTINVSGNILFTGNIFAPNVVQSDSKWQWLNLTYWGADATRTSTYTTGYSYFGEGGVFSAFGPLTLASTFTGTLKLNTILATATVTHESGTLDVNGQQLQVTTSYSSTNSSAAKAIISGTDIYTNPSIYIAATSGTPWSFAYSNLLTSNYKIWVYCKGGTVSHGGTSRQTMNQPSFDLTERVSAYTLAPATDFRVSGFRINNYTVPNGSVWSIGGNEFTVYTGGLSAPANFTVNINKTDSLELVNQLYCDSNSFTWPQVTFNTSAKLITGNWQFKNVSINGNTTVTSPGQFVAVTGTINGVSGSYGPTAILDITGSTWQFTGANPITNDSIAGIEFTVKSNDLTGILKFSGSTGSNTGNQIATFSNGYGGRIINDISYNLVNGIGTLTIATSQYYSAIYGNTTTLIGQLDFGYNTASMAFSGFYDPIRVVGSKFNLGSSFTKYITGAIYNAEASSTISADYLTITNSTVSGGGGWYAGANSVDNGGNSGWYFYAPATFSLNRSAATVDEGGSVTITLTTNASNGTLVPYTITGITSADISGASLTGNFTVSSGTANVVLNIANDYNTEGSETLTLALNNGAASIAVAINDTSLLPTYSLQRSAVSVTEGGSFTITLTTTNLPNAATVPYTITGVSSSDINNASLTGNFTISGNSASLVVNTTWDYVTEGQETFTLTLNPTYGTGSAISVAINNLLHPTYALAATPTTLNEGGNFTITLTTTDVPDNTTVPYTITGVSTADIAGASLTGNFTVVSNIASIVFTTSADYLTEGDETFVITLNTIGTTVSVLIADYTKTRTYSLSTSATTVTEGDVFVITLNTTNVFNATTVPYTITGVSTADISGASLTGNFTITSNSGTQSFTTTADLVAEGSETFTLTLGSPASGSINVSITDPVVAGNKGNFLSFFD